MSNLFLVDDEKGVPGPGTFLPDARQREDALDVHRSWVVEAPAGSGKTGLLIQRYLKLLADDSVHEPEQVLAITFTRKATAELRERVLDQLQAAATSGSDAADDAFGRDTRMLARAVLERDRLLNWSLLEQPQRLSIRTIDSVCSEIAGALPMLSGGRGNSTPVDNVDRLYEEAARRTFLHLGGTDKALDAALVTVLLHRDGDLANCEQLLVGMLKHREQWGELVPMDQRSLDDTWLDAHVLPKIERALDQVICTALTQFTKTMPAELLDELTLLASEMAHLDGYRGKASPIALCAGRRRSPAKTAEDLEYWQALTRLLIAPSSDSWRKGFNNNQVFFNTGKAERDRLERFVAQLQGREDVRQAACAVQSLPPARYPAEQWNVAKALFRVLKRALIELQLVFAERGECDYTEVALAARTALGSEDGPVDLESALGVHLQHLLVDEMQDTSSSQHELLHRLTEGWDGQSQTVFLVGDPKQSIYLFRQARVERFLRLMRSGQLGDLPLETLRLSANFRSQAALVDDFNVDFSRIFPGSENAVHPEEVPYTAVSAMKPASNLAAAREWHCTVLAKDSVTQENHRNKARQRAKDAIEICKIVNSWRNRPLPPGRSEPWTIAVLVRSRLHLEQIVGAFNDTRSGDSIPYRAVDIEPLKDRDEVRDLFALTRALLHPADRTAWLSVLRAPWCGFTLADLHLLTGADNSAFAEQSMPRLLAERGDLLSEQACARLERIWTVMQAGAKLAERQSTAEVVERTWRSLGGDAYCRKTELTNARRYLELLDGMEQEAGTIDVTTLKDRLDVLFAAPQTEAGAVDLLTIHKAKGLEWDVVIVPSLERRVGQVQGRLLNWLERDSADEEAAHVLLAPIVSKGEASNSDLLVQWIRDVHTAREAAECKRLLYVASTRAKEELHLFASPMASSGGTIKPESGSLLEAAWPAVSARFEAVATASAVSADAEILPVGDAEAMSGLRIAASVGSFRPRSRIERLPDAFDPAIRFLNPKRLSYGAGEDGALTPQFSRPEGSFAARAFGNTVHAFLEQVALRLAAGEQPGPLLAALPGWDARIAGMLRSEGLAPAAVERLTERVLFALENTLQDQYGVWALSPHQAAETEFALTAWQGRRSTIRVDRIFRAGPEPIKPGTDCLWIVDYKTASHDGKNLDAFLQGERAKYAPQLHTYAEILSGGSESKPEGSQGHLREFASSAASMRLALYYPMLQRLIWWNPVQETESPKQLSLGW